MATEEDLGQSRNEPATPRRREEAREQGRVAYSPDLTSGLILVAALVVLAWTAPAMSAGLVNGLRLDLLNCRGGELGPEEAQQAFVGLLGRGMEVLGLLLGLLVVVGLGACVMQVGFVVTPGLLGVDLARLSPANGWARLFSLAGGGRGLIALCKVAIVATVVYWVIKARGGQIARLSELHLSASTRQAWTITLHVALAIAASLVLLGIADYAYRLWHLERSLRMTTQEMKEEMKREEGDPLIKARVRKLQREAAHKRMFQDVSRASVVVTNPTHLAVALHYDRGMAAPRVVAKGAGHVAQRIIDLARRHAVPVVERKPLAQALFKVVKVGQEIPAALYYVVAEVLAYVYRLRGGPVAPVSHGAIQA